MQRNLAAWSFVIAGVIFLAAGAIPVIRGDGGRPILLILAIAFLLIGGGIARKTRSDTTRPPG